MDPISDIELGLVEFYKIIKKYSNVIDPSCWKEILAEFDGFNARHKDKPFMPLIMCYIEEKNKQLNEAKKTGLLDEPDV